MRMHPEESAAAARLFSGLVVLPVDSRAGWQAGQWRRDFAARGVAVWQADCLIAATAMVIGASLATGNPQDFPMSEVDVSYWPVGEQAVRLTISLARPPDVARPRVGPRSR